LSYLQVQGSPRNIVTTWKGSDNNVRPYRTGRQDFVTDRTQAARHPMTDDGIAHGLRDDKPKTGRPIVPT